MIVEDKEYKMLNLIDSALLNNKFILYYQPIFSTIYKGYKTAEVLLRMLDENNNIINPNDFIYIAEKNEKIEAITYSVFHTLCKNIQTCAKFKNIIFSVNISPLLLLKEHFASNIIGILNFYNVDFKNVVLEITESVPYTITETIRNNILCFSKNNIGISLDDIGKGSSNLTKLNELPFNYIKIDKIYIDCIEKDLKVQNLVKSLIMFSKSKNIMTVAEGVENNNQKIILEKLKCEFLQGYFFSKPLCEKDFFDII